MTMKTLLLLGGIGWDINIESFLEKDAEFVMYSYGGDAYEGLAIHDYVKARGLSVGAIGMAASSTTAALAGSPTRWATPNTRFMIHAPWGDVRGNGTQVESAAKELLAEQEKWLQLYIGLNPSAEAEITELYTSERVFDAETALRIGLITEIREWANAALAETPAKSYYDFFYYAEKLEKTMSKKAFLNLGSLFASTKAMLGLQASVVTAVDGTELDFGDVAVTLENLEIGMTATVGGTPASGTFTLSDGRTVTFENGVVTAIAPAVAATDATGGTTDSTTELAQARAENTRLQAEVTRLKAEVAGYTTRIAGFEANLREINQAVATRFAQGRSGVDSPSVPTTPTSRTITKKQ